MTNREAFKKSLQEHMRKANMNQRELAKAVGMSESSVHCWLTGKAFPRIDVIQKIADVLGCQTDDLITAQPSPDPSYVMELFAGASQPFHPSIIAMLEERARPQTPQEDAKMAVLWRSASLRAKRAAIAVLESIAESEMK